MTPTITITITISIVIVSSFQLNAKEKHNHENKTRKIPPKMPLLSPSDLIPIRKGILCRRFSSLELAAHDVVQFFICFGFGYVYVSARPQRCC